MRHLMGWASQGLLILAVVDLAWQHFRLVKRVEWLEELKIAELVKKAGAKVMSEPHERFR